MFQIFNWIALIILLFPNLLRNNRIKHVNVALCKWENIAPIYFVICNTNSDLSVDLKYLNMTVHPIFLKNVLVNVLKLLIDFISLIRILQDISRCFSWKVFGNKLSFTKLWIAHKVVEMETIFLSSNTITLIIIHDSNNLIDNRQHPFVCLDGSPVQIL